MKPFIYVHLLSDGGHGIYLGCAEKSAVEASAELEAFNAESIALYHENDVSKLKLMLETMTADRDAEKAMKVTAREQRDRVTSKLTKALGLLKECQRLTFKDGSSLWEVISEFLTNNE